jgi:hypothetical protein
VKPPLKQGESLTIKFLKVYLFNLPYEIVSLLKARPFNSSKSHKPETVKLAKNGTFILKNGKL